MTTKNCNFTLICLVGLFLSALPLGAKPNFSGRYKGSYIYGRSYGIQVGESNTFNMEVSQRPGSNLFRAVIWEPYSGFGVAGKDGKLWADVQGSVAIENGKVKIRFEKTYRYFRQPGDTSVTYEGTYDPASGTVNGVWFFKGSQSEGIFKLEGVALSP